jgi:RNA polymerase sigma-70 factor, ECF subfamily
MDSGEVSAFNISGNEIIVSLPSKTDRWRLWISERAEVFLLYSRQCTRNEEDARDVVQEALAESWQRSGGQIPDHALVFATIRRRAIDFGRSADSRSRREQNFAHETDFWFQPDYSQSDTHRAVAEALRNLPENLRETVTLKLWGDLTFPQIAEITKVPTPTATSRYRNALERLRETLTDHFS